MREIQNDLNDWAEKEDIEPILCWAGALTAFDNTPPSAEFVNQELDSGVTAIWLPVFNHANTLNRVGGKPIWWDPETVCGSL